jgi:hypothetical protein
MKQAVLTQGESQARRPVGRQPIPYVPEIVDEILAAYGSTAKSMVEVLAGIEGAPSLPVWHRWLNSNDELRLAHARAKEAKADYLAGEIIPIADEDEGDAELRFNKDGKPYAKMNGRNVRRAEVMINARKWAASKLAPRQYGDSIDVTSGGQPLPAPVLNQVTIDQRVQTIMQLAAARREADSLLE